MSKNSLSESKSLLAKLLATENITVRHLDVKTAYFNTKDRVLTCPIWKDMSGFLYDLIMGHEVGHALFTPADEWEKAVLSHPKKWAGFLNCVEDARIEKKIKRKFPGIRKSFIAGYQSLLDRDFFGIAKLKGDTSGLNLGDRLNLYFKCGSLLVIKFSDEERVFVKRMENAETFDEVIKITDDLYKFIKENEQDKINSESDIDKFLEDAIKQAQKEKQKKDKKKDQKKDQETESEKTNVSVEDENSDDSDFGSDDDDETIDSDESSEDGEESDNNEDSDESKDGDSNDDSESSEDGEEKDSPVEGGKEGGVGSEQPNEDPQSVTDKAYRDHEQDLIDGKAKPYILLDLPECDIKKTVVPCINVIDAYEIDAKRSISSYNTLISSYEKVGTYEELSSKVFKLFLSKNSRYIDLLVKEFEMRKNAKAYSRQLESKTGELDTRSLAKYKFTNDIFRKVTEVQKGKSHGMVMFVDMSSSMNLIIRNTFEQAVILALFCKKVGIPFEIYGFSDIDKVYYNYQTYDSLKFTQKTVSAFQLPSKSFHLKTLINSSLSLRDFSRALNMMIFYGTTYGAYGIDQEIASITKKLTISTSAGQMNLSGTPFLETLVASRGIINHFKNTTRVDIVNVVYLTDGEGNMSVQMPSMYSNYYAYDYNKFNLGFVDPHTKIRVMVDMKDSNPIQAAITKLIREITDCRHIGFYVGKDIEINAKLSQAIKYVDNKKQLEIKKQYKENGFFCVPNIGYDSYYYIKLKDGAVKDESFNVHKDATIDEIQQAFSKAQDKKHSNRALVSSFAKEIAE
jgi:hypothetical protein